MIPFNLKYDRFNPFEPAFPGEPACELVRFTFGGRGIGVNHHLPEPVLSVFCFARRKKTDPSPQQNFPWEICCDSNLVTRSYCWVKPWCLSLCLAIETFLLKVQARLRAAAEVAGETSEQGVGGRK